MREPIRQRLQQIQRKPEIEEMIAAQAKRDRRVLGEMARKGSELAWKVMVNKWRKGE